MSGGCYYCPIYGSEEQKLEHAKQIKLRTKEYHERGFLLISTLSFVDEELQEEIKQLLKL